MSVPRTFYAHLRDCAALRSQIVRRLPNGPELVMGDISATARAIPVFRPDSNKTSKRDEGWEQFGTSDSQQFLHLVRQ